MKKGLLRIDVSNTKSKEEDLLTIQFKDEDTLHVNFSKLIGHSKYIRDNYKYSEALDSIQSEIEEIETKYNISEESIKLFIQLIQEDKIDIPLEHYKNIYMLSEYFCIPKFISVLDNISKEELFQDLDFTIQFLIDSETSENGLETKLMCKIENFLIERINECIKNKKFRELPVPMIYRIVDQSKEKVDHDLLVDFIFESAETHFILLRFVELDKLKDEKVKKLIKFIDEKDESTKKMCLEYMPFNLSFIKNIINKNDQLFTEMNQAKQELKKEKIKYDQTKREIDQAEQEKKKEKIKYDQTKQELNQAELQLDQINHEYNQEKIKNEEIKHELNQAELKLNQIKQEFNQEKIKHEQTKEELDKCKKEFMQVKDELNQMKIIINKYSQSIVVGGYNKYNELGEKPNNNNKNSDPIIYPSILLSFDPSSLLSYSVQSHHSVLVMSDGSLKGVGDNSDGQISSTLQKSVIDHFTDFCIKDNSGRQLAAVSAVCCQNGTLYMLSKSSGNERQLVFCDKDINRGDPVFLDIGNHHPVSLFGGYYHSAAIGSEGEVIFINRNSVIKSPDSPIKAVSLPDGEKASSVACCNDSVVVLSSNGRVFESPVGEESSLVRFTPVSELSDQEIVCVSGTRDHCLAVSKEGHVFGRGSNGSGKFGLGKRKEKVSSFTEISSLAGYEIREAYAGFGHSLFETREGKILSCGWNFNGELLLSSKPEKNVFSPTETTIKSGATFCIAGANHSLVFIGSSPPPNTPNMRIHHQ